MSARARRRPQATPAWQPAAGDRWQDWGEHDEPEGRRGRRKRARLISPARVLLFLAVLVASGIAAYGLFIEGSTAQLPISITGLGLLAVLLLLLSLSLARAAAQLGRDGRAGRALLAAIFGGFCILGAAGAGSGAIVLAMLVAL